MFPSLAVLIVMLLVSIVAFAAYFIDKRNAQKHDWRIPESVLLGLGFCGGAIGALLCMHILRHKTNHWYFWVVNILGLACQVALVIFLAFN